MPLIDPELMAILVCPACRSSLAEEEAESRLRCTGCGRTYPVREGGIPVMLLDDGDGG
ncbi:MAG: Trm112 family protein [Acidimicrobiia bacterium]|jgi:uncharacterized protein